MGREVGTDADVDAGEPVFFANIFLSQFPAL